MPADRHHEDTTASIGAPEEAAVVSLLHRAADRTTLPSWDPDLDAVVDAGIRRRRTVRAGLAGAAAVAAAAVVAVTVQLGGTGLDAAPSPQVANPGPLLKTEGYRGPATFDALGERPGLCPRPFDEAGEERVDLPDGRPAVVPTDVVAPLVGRLGAAVADVGLQPNDWSVQRSTTFLTQAPCGPLYDVVPAEEAGSVSLRVTWLGTSPARGICDGDRSDLCAAGVVDGVARWRSAPVATEVTGDGEIVDVAGVDLVVELVGDDPALLADPTRPGAADVPVVELVAIGDVEVAQMLEVALAEDWHALAAQVEADLIATVPVSDAASSRP
ncbi:hypothetical protein [Jannaschia sp. R86511]|uniref:hypothetical protein n=1 Tax=Jannaschia sp. R86511 TaxID=3093853 RepID=UPI0036D28593